jgi:hypothetical protein
MIYFLSLPDRSAIDDDPDASRVAYATAFDLTREAAVEGEPLSAILGRVMVALLGTVPIDEVEPSERDAIRRGIDDAMAGLPRP